MTIVKTCLGTVLAASLAISASIVGAQAQEAGRIGIELNQSQQNEDACRLSFLMTNETGTDLEALTMQVVIFGTDERIRQVVSLSAGAMPDKKLRVRQFDLPQTQCGEIGRILLNEYSACKGAGADINPASCLAATEVSSRTEIELVL
ncbi:hypothetical protein ACKTEK_05805 [Tepidamorphus sp. 3E244]|uniref:hypothetical protein n=1 Tax=Tepidamorphus sp. 3E244 TaxID=3385498 RepID=UPI0038FC7F05